MALNHLALCTLDPESTHLFYTEVMGFEIAGIEADDQKGNKYKHVFYNTGSGVFLAYYDMAAFDSKPFQSANMNITQAMGVGSEHIHVAWEAHDEEGLTCFRNRWLSNGYEVLRTKTP